MQACLSSSQLLVVCRVGSVLGAICASRFLSTRTSELENTIRLGNVGVGVASASWDMEGM